MIRVPAVERAILRPRSSIEKVAWTVASVAIPTVLRWVIDRGASGVPFVTYFPAVVLASLFLGWRWAGVTALCSAIIGNRLFRPGQPIFEFDAADFIMAGLFVFSCAILIHMGHLLRQLLLAERDAREREIILNRELKHRVKNMLSVIQAIAATTFRRTGPEGFIAAFSDRVSALARATDLSMNALGQPQLIVDIASTAIAPFRSQENFRIEGRPVAVPASSCVPLSLALHELCTNALKYGSLSCPGGWVELTWHCDETAGQAIIRWKEVSGPPVEPPTRTGTGSLLLRSGFGLEITAKFLPDGVECVIILQSAPVQNLQKKVADDGESMDFDSADICQFSGGRSREAPKTLITNSAKVSDLII